MTKNVKEYLTFRGGEWFSQLFIEGRDLTKFKDVKFFYANIIDYIRIIMCLIAGYTITTEWHLFNAFLILGATLLDWVDGPVARAYNQCSVMGCGLDWLADLLSQIVMVLWWTRYDFSVVPWLFIATFIEVGTGLFDYATTTTLKYPILHQGQSGFFVILEWSMPLNTYTHFGSFIWYAYPIYCLVRTLECCYGYNQLIAIIGLSTALSEQNFVLILFLLNRYLLLVPSILYIWCEAAYGCHIIRSWSEPARKNEVASKEIIYDDASTSFQGGFIHYQPLSDEYQKLIDNCYEDLRLTLNEEYQSALSKCEVFWINLWKRTGEPTRQIKLKQRQKLDDLVYSLIEKYYHSNTVLLDGYGYLLNPINSRSQAFHVDYTCDYSSLFIPLVPLSADNAIQYIIPSPSINSDLLKEATRNCDRVAINSLLEDNGHYSVRQCIANSFTVLKMDFGTIHRAISNQSSYHRPMFYISVIKKDTANQTTIPDESFIETIKRD